MKKFFAILSLLLATNANAATSISLFGGEPADVSFFSGLGSLLSADIVSGITIDSDDPSSGFIVKGPSLLTIETIINTLTDNWHFGIAGAGITFDHSAGSLNLSLTSMESFVAFMPAFGSPSIRGMDLNPSFSFLNLDDGTVLGVALAYGDDLTKGIWLSNIHVSPVPEPSTYTMLLLGLGALLVFFRRQSSHDDDYGQLASSQSNLIAVSS